MNQQMDDNVEYIEEGAISDSMMAKGGIAAATKDRKKSLMTRLIPGRNAPLGRLLRHINQLIRSFGRSDDKLYSSVVERRGLSQINISLITSFHF